MVGSSKSSLIRGGRIWWSGDAQRMFSRELLERRCVVIIVISAERAVRGSSLGYGL